MTQFLGPGRQLGLLELDVKAAVEKEFWRVARLVRAATMQLDASEVPDDLRGLESEFDWDVVKTVIGAERDGTAVLLPRTSAKPVGAAQSPGVLPVIDGPMI